MVRSKLGLDWAHRDWKCAATCDVAVTASLTECCLPRSVCCVLNIIYVFLFSLMFLLCARLLEGAVQINSCVHGKQPPLRIYISYKQTRRCCRAPRAHSIILVTCLLRVERERESAQTVTKSNQRKTVRERLHLRQRGEKRWGRRRERKGERKG